MTSPASIAMSALSLNSLPLSPSDISFIKRFNQRFFESREDIFEGRDDVDVSAHLSNEDGLDGEFLDCFFVDDTHLALASGSVAGSGFLVTLITYIIRAGLRSSLAAGHDLGATFNNLNASIAKGFQEYAIFACVWACILNTHTGKLTHIDAGHVAPFIRHGEGGFNQLPTRKNAPLGARKASMYTASVAHLSPGDSLFGPNNAFAYKGNAGDGTLKASSIRTALDETDKRATAKDAIDSMRAYLEGGNGGLAPLESVALFSLRFLKYRDTQTHGIIAGPGSFNAYGGVRVEISRESLAAANIHYKDIVSVAWPGSSLDMPVVPNFRYLHQGQFGLLVPPKAEAPCSIMALGSSIKAETDIGEITDFPIEVTITLKESGGYEDGYAAHDLSRTDIRADYPHLSDEEFANFRAVRTTGMGESILYRGSIPNSSAIGRNKYADAALKAHGIKSAINLDQTDEAIRAADGYEGSYYRTCTVYSCKIDTDFNSPETRTELLRIFRIAIDAPKPMYVHCIEGQDRTGFVCCILEALAGAKPRELLREYLATFYNYYGVERGTLRYASIGGRFYESLENAFEDSSDATNRFYVRVRKYLGSLGMADAEIDALEAAMHGETPAS